LDQESLDRKKSVISDVWIALELRLGRIGAGYQFGRAESFSGQSGIISG
jgi:hypothetical protein